jgi:hypothetical protein
VDENGLVKAVETYLVSSVLQKLLAGNTNTNCTNQVKVYVTYLETENVLPLTSWLSFYRIPVM